MDDFFIRALLGGVGIAVVAGPLGCVVVWRRMAYFGAALSHSALLGVALGFLAGVSTDVGILVFCLIFAGLLSLLERQRLLASDTLLGILAHGSLALGLIALASMEALRIDLNAYLFGDVLAITRRDLYLIYALAILVLGVLLAIWRPLLSATVQEDLAAVEGVPVERVRLMFVLLMACVIAIGMKVVGVLLIVSLLIIPPAAARYLAATPERMAIIAALLGGGAAVGGLAASLRWDIPTGPAIVVVAALLFVLVAVIRSVTAYAGLLRP
uniref:High-affinity zinc uptake system membrane protein ZnuB n=1 Tax=Candidatus Kentrum sp. FM TaxID=2126340 RepID=A0A450SW71_9GAMM|nr:MAG: zinc transport system permease protein [Candidatus Kentron sp. FM]VFJ58575.1 MAG: zinc transport system permease protein [Candidatus Kentron sp. FM]VFK11560.1 MAG: zinc transport system permease protein [Candidatus Kentron sp. FM]